MMHGTTRRGGVLATVTSVAVTLLGLAGTAVAHENHSNATGHEGGGIPWFPIIVGGLFLLMVGIMVVRRVIDHGDGEDDEQTVGGDGAT